MTLSSSGLARRGSSAAIRLKQLGGDDISVVVLEKGSEVGAHILSGAVLDPCGLDALIPDWAEKGAPLNTKVTSRPVHRAGRAAARCACPTSPCHRCSATTAPTSSRWAMSAAGWRNRPRQLGVEIFPGMACSELVWGEGRRGQGRGRGRVRAERRRHAVGRLRAGHGTAWQICLPCRGRARLAVEAGDRQIRRSTPNSDVQKYGLGMKELWEVRPENHKPGQVTHTMGWPLGGNAGGGSFMYHMENNQVCIGFVVHLNYANPHLYPYMEFQRFKHHPAIAEVLEGGKRVAYGARAITEGGWQSLPKLVFPGGALLGCAAGMINVPRIKGNHNAMLSGKAAAEAAYAAIGAGRASDELDRLRGRGAHRRDCGRPEKGAQCQAVMVEAGHDRLAGAGRLRHVGGESLRLQPARHHAGTARRMRRRPGGPTNTPPSTTRNPTERSQLRPADQRQPSRSPTTRRASRCTCS